MRFGMFFSSCAAVLCLAHSVNASELGDWTGAYGGIQAGAAIGTAQMDFSPEGTFRGPIANDIADRDFWKGSRDLDSTGFTGGLQGGYLWGRDRLLFGLEGDVSYLGLEENSSVTATVPFSSTPYRLEQSVETYFMASLRPRIGYVPEAFSGSVMLYATGGVTLTRVHVDQRFRQLNAVDYFNRGLSEDKTLVGWTAGGGVEYALSTKWSIKAEYLYADLGSVENNSVPGSATYESYTTDNKMDLTAHFFRLGTSYHF